jgi:hypothetical protein
MNLNYSTTASQSSSTRNSLSPEHTASHTALKRVLVYIKLHNRFAVGGCTSSYTTHPPEIKAHITARSNLNKSQKNPISMSPNTTELYLLYRTTCFTLYQVILRFTIGLQNILRKKYTLCGYVDQL